MGADRRRGPPLRGHPRNQRFSLCSRGRAQCSEPRAGPRSPFVGRWMLGVECSMLSSFCPTWSCGLLSVVLSSSPPARFASPTRLRLRSWGVGCSMLNVEDSADRRVGHSVFFVLRCYSTTDDVAVAAWLVDPRWCCHTSASESWWRVVVGRCSCERPYTRKGWGANANDE